MIVALTGGISSGKTTVANLFEQQSIDVIDTDQLAREGIAPNQPAWREIVDHFGDAICQADQQINRQKLRHIIFADPNEKAWLENCLHPQIRQAARHAIAHSQSPYCLLVIPLLNADTQKHYPPFGRILLVDLPTDLQSQRLQQRDGIDSQPAAQMIAAQPSREMRRTLADDIIDNSASQTQLTQTVSALHQRYLALASS